MTPEDTHCSELVVPCGVLYYAQPRRIVPGMPPYINVESSLQAFIKTPLAEAYT